MSFYTPLAFYLLLLLPIFLYFKSKDETDVFNLSGEMKKKIVLNRYSLKKQTLFLALSFIFMVISLSRPIYTENKKESSSLDVDMVVALDISRSMMAKDIYPNRFELAKNKLSLLIKMLKGERVALLAFSNQPFIISPLTNNYQVLTFLVDNLNLENINKNGTDLLKLINASSELVKKDKKPLVIFTDGSENNSFTKEIELAKQKGISVFIYNIGTKTGSAIDENGKLVKDRAGNIVITKINEKIKDLADKTDGKYLKYSINSDDLKEFVNVIKSEFNIDETKEENMRDKKELFYIPLLLAFIFLILSRVRLEIRR